MTQIIVTAAGVQNGGDIGGTANNEVVTVLGGQAPITWQSTNPPSSYLAPVASVPRVYVAAYLPNPWNWGNDASHYINQAIQACPPGGEVIFPIRPNGAPLLVNSMVVGKSNVTLVGSGNSKQQNYPHIKAMNNAQLPAVVASPTWASSGTTADQCFCLRNLNIDGNVSNNGTTTSGATGQATWGHGVAMATYRGELSECHIANVAGDGVTWQSTNYLGGAVTGGAQVECGAWRTTVEYAGVAGFSVRENFSATGKITDGFLSDCEVNTCGQQGFYLSDAADWFLIGNHPYGCGTHGYYLRGCDYTRVIGNYSESWGQTANTGNIYGFYFDGYGDGNVVMGNVSTINYTTTTGNTPYCFYFATHGANPGTYTVGGNTATNDVSFHNDSGDTLPFDTASVGFAYVPLSTSGTSFGTLNITDYGNEVGEDIGIFRQITPGSYGIVHWSNQGAPALTGIASLVAGAATISAPFITTSSVVRLSRQTAGGTLGELSCLVTAGTGFQIVSSSSSETSTVYWEVLNS